MIYYISHIRDVLGNNYLGIKIDKNVLIPFLNNLKKELSEDEYEKYTSLKIKRDGDNYHITIINVMEYNNLIKDMGVDKFTQSLQKVFSYPVDDLKMMGLGTAHRNNNRAYFVVCKSEKLDAIRKRYNLGDKDFHITLGFHNKDVFGVRKNEVLTQRSEFLKTISDKYEKNKNWNFIKSIENFKFEGDNEIIVVDITDTSLKIKYKGFYMEIGLIDDKLRVVSKYTIGKEIPKLSQTEINKYISKNKNYNK